MRGAFYLTRHVKKRQQPEGDVGGVNTLAVGTLAPD